jgi:hypothetical protein
VNKIEKLSEKLTMARENTIEKLSEKVCRFQNGLKRNIACSGGAVHSFGHSRREVNCSLSLPASRKYFCKFLKSCSKNMKLGIHEETYTRS